MINLMTCVKWDVITSIYYMGAGEELVGELLSYVYNEIKGDNYKNIRSSKLWI